MKRKDAIQIKRERAGETDVKGAMRQRDRQKGELKLEKIQSRETTDVNEEIKQR